MANITLPNLRHIGITSADTITVPAGQTWIVKNASFQFEHSNGSLTQGMTITVTIDSNSSVVGQITITNDTGTAGSRLGILEKAEPIFCSTMILQPGDTLVVTVDGSPTTTKLDVYYWIMELDF